LSMEPIMKINPALYSRDGALPALSRLDIQELRTQLGDALPENALDSPLQDYEISNIRYKPNEKMVLALTSAKGEKPLALRIYPPSKTRARWQAADKYHPHLVYEIPGLDAVAWTFPAERKLRLAVINDRVALSDLLKKKHNEILNDLTMVHYVPEHTYTARLEGYNSNQTTTNYLKIYYNNTGARTCRLMHHLKDQVDNQSLLAFPQRVSYSEEHRLLVQDALPIEDSPRDILRQIRALAEFHKLDWIEEKSHLHEPAPNTRRTRALVCMTFPELAPRTTLLLDRLSANPPSSASSPVLIHGDAHFGNLLQLKNNRVGFIDLDQCCWGSAERDLAAYFGFLLWTRLGKEFCVTEMMELLDAYNGQGHCPISLESFATHLAANILCDRISRGIARGKILCVANLELLLNLGEKALDLANFQRARRVL